MKNSINPLTEVQLLMDKLDTGDVVLCHSGKGDDPIDKAIEFFTKSPWEHAGMIIRNPWWCDDVPDGLYIFQSNSGPNGYYDILNGKVTGVTLNRLDDFLANRDGVYIRTLSGINMCDVNKDLFVKNFQIAHGKPYDKNICSWIGTGIGSFCNFRCLSRKTTPAEDSTFWCSALVAFMYVKMKWIAPLDWSCQTPADLSKWTLPVPHRLGEPWLLK